MSTVILNQSGRLKTYSLANVPVTATALFTATKNLNETVLEILICNKDAAARTVTITRFQSVGSVVTAIASAHSMAANSEFRLDFPIQMLENDQIRVTAGTAATLDAHVTVSEGAGRGEA